MNILLAGGTGAIGKRLIPLLTGQGHRVSATTRSEAKRPLLEQQGAHPVVVDVLDSAALTRAVMHAEPEVVIHQLSGLTGAADIKHFDREFAATNRLRTEGTDRLLAAARAAGARRFIAQSYGNWNYERRGGLAKREDDPLDPDPPREQAESLRAIRYLENALAQSTANGLEALALRYANFYGPGTSYAAVGEIIELVRRRRLPIIGDGGGVWSFVHIDDAAAATVAAVEHGASGVYNIADDEPAPVREWLPVLAAGAGAKPPRHVPLWLGRIAVGEVGVSMMTRIRGADNGKAKRELGLTLRHPSWREGFSVVAAESPTLAQAR
jgi:nucleoside-diphosphate-sugar epimerase